MEVERIQAQLQKGKKAYVSGRTKEAGQIYKHILSTHPGHPDANHSMANLLVKNGKCMDALSYFKAAIRSKTSSTEFWLDYINTLIKLEQFTDARAALIRAKQNCLNGADFVELDSILTKGNKNKLATPHHKNNDKSFVPDNILTTLTLSKALKTAKEATNLGSFDRARQIYQDILKQYPKNRVASNKKNSEQGTAQGSSKWRTIASTAKLYLGAI